MSYLMSRDTFFLHVSLQWFEQNLASTDKQLHITLNERTEASNRRLDEISGKISDLDEKRIKDKEEILTQIDATGQELKKMLAEFKVCSQYTSVVFPCLSILILDTCFEPFNDVEAMPL